jgi:cysteine-rich repeat protein
VVFAASVGLVGCSGGGGGESETEATTSGSTTMMVQETGSSGTTEAPMVTESGGTASAGESTSTTTNGSTTTSSPDEDPECGDGAVDLGEECDDGAANGPGQACKADCTANYCGDDDQGPGEECDAGAENKDDGLCKSDCTLAGCGDGIVQPGEGCDDGNEVDDDDCSNSCKLTSCGDGTVQPPEACDDGNGDNSDGCTDFCLLPSCGDGYVQQAAGEECDDGPANDNNADCTASCVNAVCGDGLLHNQGKGSEQCDDGNSAEDDACSNLCVAATCEDQLKNNGESDVDCGGSCEGCGLGQACGSDSECESKICEQGGCILPRSCAHLLAKDEASPSGSYVIDPDGAGPAAPFEVYCDMVTAGGGWTMIGNLHSNRIPGSVFRGQRFFTAAWQQQLGGHTVTTNDQLSLSQDVFGMLDAKDLISAAGELRYSCNDQSRSLSGDAYWAPTAGEWTELLTSLIYSPNAKTAAFSANGGAFAPGSVFPTAANLQTYGCWHICGNCGPAQQQQSFQVGICGTPPSQGDNALANLRQIAIGYHDGFQQLRLECTADTPNNTPILNGTWQAWVR